MTNDRFLIYTGFAVLLISLLIVRLYKIQIVEHSELLFQAGRQQIGVELISADRGNIYDSDMRTLAYSKPYTSFYVSGKLVQKFKTLDKIANAFSKVTQKPAEYYKGIILGSNGRSLLEKTTGDTAFNLKSIKYDGLSCEEEPMRVYPFEKIASHVLGFSDKKTFRGIDGVEREFDSLLQGKQGTRSIWKDPAGNMIAAVEDQTFPAVAGNSIVLTIDKDIQQAVEEELERSMKETEADYATGIVMNPQTGEILALANVQDFNPNNYGSFSDAERRNHAVSDMYNPGSTFKAITLSAILEKNLAQESELINVEGGTYKTAAINVHDSHKFQSLTVEDVFANSSNIGMVKLRSRINDEDLYKHIRALGFGNTTQVELPAEAAGLLSKPADWDGAKRATLAYGYGISVTPLQLISAYSAIINGGTLFQPHIVKRIINSSNSVVKENTPVAIRKVISEKTSERMRKLCVRVVEHGTGDLVKMNGISIGGKTGTSRVSDKVSDKNYNASFIGFFPAEKPTYICLVVVHSPKHGMFGREVASPVFKRIAEKIIESDDALNTQHKPGSGEQKEKVNIASENSSGNENTISATSVSGRSVNDIKISKGVTPDFSGLSIRDAILVAEKLNLDYRFIGHGKVKSQSIAPGTKFRAGERITFHAKNIIDLAKI